MGAGRIAGVAGAIAVVGIGAFLLWSLRTPSPRAASGPAAAPRRSVQSAPDAAAPATSATDAGGSAAPSDPAAASPVPPGPPGPASIEGTVCFSNESEAPAPDVLLVLSRGPEGARDEVARTKSDAKGRFSFRGLPLGNYSFATLAAEGEIWDFEHATFEFTEGGVSTAELWVERPLPPGTGFPVSGTVKHEDGRPAQRFRFYMADRNTQWRVEGEQGVFRRRLPGPGRYVVRWVRADEQLWDGIDLAFEVVAESTIAVVLPAPREATLTVVDRVTGAPIAGARAYHRPWGGRVLASGQVTRRRFPPEEPLVSDASGRITLGPDTDRTTLYVVADGFAWSSVQVYGKGAVDKVLPLDPGSTLELRVENWAALESASLSLARDDPWARITLPAPDPDGVGRYEGIPSGNWTAVVRRGPDHVNGEEYGRGSFVIEAGRELSVTVAAKPSEGLPPVIVKGTVAIPEAWGARRTRIEFQGAEPLTRSIEREVSLPAAEGGAPVPYEMPPLIPGRYHVTIDPQWVVEVTVPPEGKEFHFRLPPPGTVVLRLVDAASSAPVARAQVMWHATSSRGAYRVNEASRGDAPGEFRIVAPTISVAVDVSAEGYLEADIGERDENGDWKGAIQVKADQETVVTVRLQRAGVAKIQFRWEGEEPEWDDGTFHLVGCDAEGDESYHWLEVVSGVGIADGVPAGTYRLEMGDLERHFALPPDWSVTVVVGETTTVEVPLVRKK